jgi:carboxymethylenebutenolidase
MCFDLDSHPPIAPIAGGSSDSRRFILEAEDGSEFRAFEARPAQPNGSAILILPDVRGLHPFFEELALRYAEHGTSALAIDYFGRTAGVDDRPEDFEHDTHVAQLSWDHLANDIRVAERHLRVTDPAPRSVFVTGFCLGGRLASLSATLRLGLAGVIPYYGWPTGAHRTGTPAPADVADKIECAVLAIYGEDDKGIGPDVRDAFDKALDKAGVNHRTIVYPGVGHSFFDRKVEGAEKASAEAWKETLEFIRRHTAGQPIVARA